MLYPSKYVKITIHHLYTTEDQSVLSFPLPLFIKMDLVSIFILYLTKSQYKLKKVRKGMLDLTTHSTYFTLQLYGDGDMMPKNTPHTQITREETRCRYYIGYHF